MRRSYLFHVSVVFIFLSAAVQSCKKSDGVNNNQVIETPYSIYYADSSGAVYNTNDGVNIKPLVFPPDGYPVRAIATSSSNILLAKNSLQVSTNSGATFDSSYVWLQPKANASSSTCIFYSADEKKVYVSSTQGHLGIYYSLQGGARGSLLEDSYDTVHISAAASVTSFTELQNNVMIAYDRLNNRIFYRGGTTDYWHETSINTPLPSGSDFFLTSFGNTLVAVDHSGLNGAYYSLDNGADWAAYSGLPTGHRLLSATSFGNQLLVGTDSLGVYMLNAGGSFSPSNSGLASYTVVNGIVGKANVYVGVTSPQQYIYLATNNGLYVSNDLGKTWTKTQSGNLVAIY